MKLSEAIKRLRFTIGNQNKPNQTDAEALNEILKILDFQQQKTIQDNLLFAKLYAYLLGKFAAHYTNVNDANKHLNKLLKQPLDITIDMLLMELKAMEVKQVFADDFLKDKNPTDFEKTFKNYPNFKNEFFATWEYWDKENVISHLNTNVNLSIQNLKNYV